MTKTKLWLLIATAMILLGGILFTGVMCVLGWDFTKLATTIYKTKEYTFTEAYADISIETDTADVTFLPAEDEKTKVVCYEQTHLLHSASVQENTLTVKLQDSRKWYQHIGINFASPKITVYLPKDTFENISVKVSTGNVTLSDLTCQGQLSVKVTTGDVHVTNVTCKDFTTAGSTGQVHLKNLIATEKMGIKRTTGDVRFDGCDAGEITVKTNTGSITGSLLSPKIFTTQTTTGKISVPQSTAGGLCSLTATTGNIKIECKMQSA